MTGKPYALWVRVRVVAAGKTSQWSAPFGFNTAWQQVPQRQPSPEGLIRWSTVSGATAYEIWYQNVPGQLPGSLPDADECRRRARVLESPCGSRGDRAVARASRPARPDRCAAERNPGRPVRPVLAGLHDAQLRHDRQRQDPPGRRRLERRLDAGGAEGPRVDAGLRLDGYARMSSAVAPETCTGASTSSATRSASTP